MMMRRFSGSLFHATVLACALARMGDVRAAEWEIIPSIGAGVIVTDNILLAPEGGERSETITEVVPGIEVNVTGRRLNLNLNYRLDILRYERFPERDITYHLLDGNLSASVVPDLVSVDATGTRSQVSFFTDESTPANRFSIADNRSEVVSYATSAQVTPRFGSFARALARATYGKLDYLDPEIEDSNLDNRRLRAELQSGPDFRTVGWLLGYTRTDFDVEAGGTDVYERTSISLAYHVTSRFDLTGEYGEERSNRTTIPSSRLWNVGINWRPTTRTTLAASVGEGIFGHTARLDLRHRTRYGTLDAEYFEEVTDASSILFEQRRIFPEVDPNNPNVPDFIDIIVGVPINETFLRKIGSAGFTATYRRLSYGVQISHERREFLTSNEVSEVLGGRLFGQWRLSARSGIDAFVYDQKFSFPGDREDIVRRLSVSLFHDLGRHLTMRLSVYRYDVDSTVSALSYVQRNAEANLLYTF